MTTKYENQLVDIEERLRKPGKKEKVSSAEVEHLRIQREREQKRAELTAKYPGPIKCSWAEGKPVKWEPALAVVDINGTTNAVTIYPYEEIGDGKTRLKQKIARHGYEKAVEEWALWKWHNLRGSEIYDDRDEYIVDCKPPAFVWEDEKPKVGRPRKVDANAE